MWEALASAAGGLVGGGIDTLVNLNQARINRQFQLNMSSTAYQRAMADMKAAGLNPMLAYQQGGASTSGGATASGEMREAGRGAASAAQIMMDQKRVNNETKVADAQEKKLSAETITELKKPELVMAQILSERERPAAIASSAALERAQTATEIRRPELIRAETAATKEKGRLTAAERKTEEERPGLVRAQTGSEVGKPGLQEAERIKAMADAWLRWMDTKTAAGDPRSILGGALEKVYYPKLMHRNNEVSSSSAVDFNRRPHSRGHVFNMEIP